MSASKAPSASAGPASRPGNSNEDVAVAAPEEKSPGPEEIQASIDCLKTQVALKRSNYIKKRMEENRQKLDGVTRDLYKLSTERRNDQIIGTESSVDLLAKRLQDAIDLQNGMGTNNDDEDSNNTQEDGYASSAILLGSSIAVKNAVRPIKLPEVKKLHPYTTWIFLDRNQRMTDDQSVVGRRRIYYDQNGGEALICSDSEEDAVEEEEEKNEFNESEDFISRTIVKEFGLSDVVVDLLARCLSRKPADVKARCEYLMKDESETVSGNIDGTGDVSGTGISYFDKDLDAALDSFDNLFCRRCLVFDCKLHGCSQELIFPAERQNPWAPPEAESDPCGPNCYRMFFKQNGNGVAKSHEQENLEGKIVVSSTSAQVPKRKHAKSSIRIRSKSSQSESASSNAKNVSESSDSEVNPLNDIAASHPSSPHESTLRKRNSKRIAENVVVAMRKRQKKSLPSGSDPLACEDLGLKDLNLRSNPHMEKEGGSSSPQKAKSPGSRRPPKNSKALAKEKTLQSEDHDLLQNNLGFFQTQTSSDETLRKGHLVEKSISRHEGNDDKSWRPLEKSLYEKGLEMFGRNSCLIARNLMNGWKTCLEVFKYMNRSENKLFSKVGDGANADADGYMKTDGSEAAAKGVRRRSRFLRRKGRVRRLKYTWKSAGYPSFRKRISDKKDQPCRQFNPCGCNSSCGKECPCLVNATCCEKYCGCPKSCKNRFRGCHCAKSQCRSRQCPCFAADRECDPDVCRNCWIGCGDGTLGTPFQRGDNYECRNMKLLLKQQQRVLLGRSDVSGWGAFLKNSVSKHEYLGEYTGELISHREADKRGKIYDRVNSSFLFNLNDQFVLDAFRKGDKLKFANHSPDPNCYAKVVMVAGDHRVGIFAKERIGAGEELFYDYRYEPDRAPAWARKPEASGSKKEENVPSVGRAKKHT